MPACLCVVALFASGGVDEGPLGARQYGAPAVTRCAPPRLLATSRTPQRLGIRWPYPEALADRVRSVRYRGNPWVQTSGPEADLDQPSLKVAFSDAFHLDIST